MKPENKKASKRNRHNGRINAAKARILRDGRIIKYSDGTRHACIDGRSVMVAGNIFVTVGQQVRVPR